MYIHVTRIIMYNNSCAISAYFDIKVRGKMLMLLYALKRFALFILEIRDLWSSPTSMILSKIPLKFPVNLM